MYTNNTLDIGLMWERDKIGTQHKKCSRFGHIFVRMTGEVKEGSKGQARKNEAISAAFFMLGMGWGLDMYPNMKNAAKLAVFFVSG